MTTVLVVLAAAVFCVESGSSSTAPPPPITLNATTYSVSSKDVGPQTITVTLTRPLFDNVKSGSSSTAKTLYRVDYSVSPSDPE